MNFGKCVKNLSTKFNFALRISKSIGGKNVVDGKKMRPVTYFALNEFNKNNSESMVNCNVGLLNFYCCQGERIHSIISKTDIPVAKEIIEPEKLIKIEIPLRNINNKEIDLPSSSEKEIVEPTENIISKQALNIIRIRKRKMRLHKRRKRLRKFKILIQTIRQRKRAEKNLIFEKSLQEVLKMAENFDPQKMVEEKLRDCHWEKPVTKARGRLAPNWVIKQELQRERDERVFKERIEECINYKTKL